MLLTLLFAALAQAPAHTLDSLLESASKPRGGTATGCVVRLRDDSVVWSHDSWRRMLPASTQKVLTSAALRSILGGSTTLPTRLLRTGVVTDSVLAGSLVLDGGGDPSFARGTDTFALESMARELRGANLRRVRGDLVVRDGLLKESDQLWPGSWDWDNSLTDCDGAPSAGISVAGNCPGDTSLPFPHRHAAQMLRKALERVGITVEGRDRFELGVMSTNADTILLEHRSAPLDSLLAEALAKSSNHDMETFGLLTGAASPTGVRAWGLHLVRQRLRSLGLDTTRTDLVDQCGLSRKNAISARAMCALLAKIVRDSAMDVFPLLPGPGAGTLKVRFRHGLPLGTKLHAKTGSLDGVSAMVGLLVPPGGDSLVFALFFNGHSGPATPIRFVQDQIVTVLAGGAVPVPNAQDTTPPPPKSPKSPRTRPEFLDP